ncbi:CAMK family protein kinase [Tritrichomonas foetus]|uniref:CAMK family protein kinase n=1 Tax=Tritrichomonas foetus TaxID=1144522 RepID=A0A1J4JHZ3_9EUKA|nr:CAMK family protein kinase [Tritrichomonas foetus]|eukprot:OHS98337.1 CAMK family protein kinase [Tritrichomonas foetus]
MEDEKYFFIVMEYLENGTLLEYVNKNGPLSEDSASRVFSQLISVLDYLHNTMNIIHRDIKAENIMFDKNMNIRIIDFGFSKILSSNMQIVTTSCGSPGYASPELISGFPYRTSSDIWSAGIVLYAMTTGSLPFQSFNTQRSIELIMNSDPQYPSRLSSILVDLLDKLLTKDPDLRITLDQIKEHPLVACWLHDCDYMKYALFDGKEADPQITQKLNILKYNTDTLTEDLKRHLRTPIATLYLIFKNEKTIEEMSRSNTCIRLPKLITEREDLRSTHHVLSPLKMKFAITKQNPNTKSLPQPKPVLRFEIPQPRQIANSPIVVPKIRRRERLNSADPELSLTIPRDWGSPLFLNKM